MKNIDAIIDRKTSVARFLRSANDFFSVMA